MNGAPWLDCKTFELVRNRTEVPNIIFVIKSSKWSWSSHITCMSDNSWITQITGWQMDPEAYIERGRGVKSMPSGNQVHGNVVPGTSRR